jgi:hypothetical protein
VCLPSLSTYQFIAVVLQLGSNCRRFCAFRDAPAAGYSWGFVR